MQMTSKQYLPTQLPLLPVRSKYWRPDNWFTPGRKAIFRQAAAEVWHLAAFIATIPAGCVYRFPAVTAGTRPPVVLVPGFLGKGLEFARLRKALSAQGYPVYIPRLGSQIGDIFTKSRQLAAYLARPELEGCILIGYSLGGWVSLALPAEALTRIRQIVTVGVSFQGSRMSYCLPMFIAAHQLMPNSNFIRSQQPRLAQLRSAVVNIHARHDEITLPARTNKLRGSRQVSCAVSGHLNLVLSRQGIDTILKVLEEV